VALRGLRVLDLSGCELKEIPASLSAAAGSLQQLNLSGNEIASVHVLAKLAKLEALDLSLNALAEPPWVLSALPRLRLLSVKGNLRLARDVERLQDAQLLAYLRAGSEDRMRSQTVKFVVLGHELSGKTTLLRALRAHASWYSWRPRVEGIALNDRTREVTLSEEWPAGRTHTDVHFRVLDFPGQPEYFATNRLFLAGLRETVVVICVPLLPIEHVKRVAQGEQLSREALREATDRAIKGDLRVALRLWLTEVNGLLEDEAKEAPEAKKPEILVVHSFGDVASDDLARDWCERGFTTWLKGEKGLQNLVVRGPYLVDSREITGGTSAVRTAIITVGRSIVEFRAQIPRAMYVAQEHVQVLLRPRNVLSLLELRREITALPAIRGSEARVDAALAIMRGQLDVIVSGARAFVNPQWLASFVALFTTPQHLDGLPSAIPAMPFILSKETVRMALQRKLGNEAGDASQVDDLLHVLEELDVLYPLRLRPDHVEYLVPCRFASVDGSYEVNIQYPQAFNATDRLVLCLELEAQNGHSMPLMLLARLLYMFLRLPLFLPRGDGFGAMYRMSRTRLFVKTPLDSQLLVGLVGRSGVELRYVGASRTAFDVQQAELRQLLECVDNALRRTEKWPKVEYSATLRCAGCGGEFNPLNVMCSRQPLHLRLNSTAIDVVCQGIYIDGLRECTKVVRNWNKVARQRSAQPNDAARNDPWPWPRQPQTFTWDRLMQVDRLGEGHFGIVLSARLDGRWPVAVKALRPPKEIADVDKAIREREREAYAYLALSRHRNVVPLVGRVDRVHFGNMVYEGAFVMPLASRGSLEKKLKDYGPLLGREIVDAVAQIAEGLAHLHAHRLLHRDIAPRNLLEFSDGRIALTDFGLSRESQVNEGEELITRVLLEDCFPVRFAAPEVMKTGPNNQYFAASDVWMLALTAWHLITGREPFANIPDSFDAAEAAAEGRVRLEWESLADEVAPRPLRELLAQCCALEREKRPTAAQIAQRARALLDSIGRAPSEVVPPPLDGPLLHGDGEEKLDGGPVPQPPPPPPPPPDQPYPAPPASPAGGAGEAELLARKLDQVLDAVHEIADHRK
jgi:serine/threonine protein kinase